MSCLNKLSNLLKELESIKSNKENEMEIIKLCSSFYYMVDRLDEKEKIINKILSLLGDEYLRIYHIARYILDKNIIKEAKQMVFYNWIFINKNIIKREVIIKKVSKGYLILKKEDYPPTYYLDIIGN